MYKCLGCLQSLQLINFRESNIGISYSAYVCRLFSHSNDLLLRSDAVQRAANETSRRLMKLVEKSEMLCRQSKLLYEPQSEKILSNTKS